MKIMVPIIIIGILGIFLFLNKKSTPTIDIPENAFLVDVRTAKEFDSGSVPGAVNITLGEIVDQIDTFKNKESIIVFCRTGIRSGQAKSVLEDNGIINVVNGGSWGNVKKSMEK